MGRDRAETKDGALAPQEITDRKRTCQRAPRRLFMVRCEFGPSSRRRLAHWLSGAFAGTIAGWPVGCANRPGRVVDLSGWLAAFGVLASVRTAKRKPGIDLPEGPAARLGSNRDIGACGAA